MINIIKYQFKISLKYIVENYSTKIEDIKVLIISDNINLYKDILQKLNVKETNITTIGVSNFDFFSNTDLVNSSFDLIVGNPPNTRQEKLKELKPTLKEYKSFNNTADLNIYFFEKGYNLLKKNGILSFITSNKYTKAKYGKEFRVFILANTSIVEYIDFNDTSIMTFSKSQKKNNIFNYCKVERDNINLEQYITEHKYQYPQNNLEIDIFNFYSSKVLSIKRIIENNRVIDCKKESSKFISAVFNSQIANFYKSLFYKNNIKELPIPQISKEQQKPYEILVDYILFAKEQNMNLETSLFKSIIDGMVYDLYFEEDMKKADCFISDEVTKVIKDFDGSLDMIKNMYKVFNTNKTIGRGLIYRRVISVVKTINGDKND